VINFFAFLLALAISSLLVPPLILLARRFSIIDLPNERKVHACAIPRIGGIAMVMGAIVPMLLWLPMVPAYVSVLLGAAVIVLFGFLDDRFELGYRVKFCGQLLAIAIVVLGGGVVIDHVPFWGFDPLPGYVALPLTVFALLGATNAVNLADGLDGLAGGTSLLTLVGVGLLAHLAGGAELVFLVLAVCGGLLGFLRYNSWPAQVFMGDAGSQYLGFMLGVVVILLTQQVHAALNPMVALLLLGVPVIDTLMVMIGRIREGRSPFAADRSHLHHRLLAMGLDHYEAVFAIYVAQALMVVVAVLMRYQTDVVLVIIYTGFVAGLLWIYGMRRVEVYRAPVERKSMFAQLVDWLRASGWAARGPHLLANVSVSILFVLVAALAAEVPHDFGLLAWLLFAALVLVVVQRRYALRWVEQLVIYCTAAAVVYLLTVQPGALARFELVTDTYVVLLALVIMLGVRFTRGRTFKVSPLDFLVLFIVLAVPQLTGGEFREVGMAIAKLLVVLYAVEFVLGMVNRSRWALRTATLGTLALLGLRGLFL
jgi:UDP-GlcNAc:undecaprenyl-phosphate GlcNAc-1-phosphate transferase